MTAEDLFNAVMNDPNIYKSITFAVSYMRSSINRIAEMTAKANAEWHDEPRKEDYDEHHAPAAEQFTKDVRDETIRDLVAYFLKETS